MDTSELLKRYAVGERDFPDVELSGADLREVNLSEANLSGANLSGAILREAHLCRAELMGADLSGANLMGANLRSADLMGANLRSADLMGANLMEAMLMGANLSSVELSGANLSGADLCEANLSEVNLSRGDLSGADLCEANLSGANLSGANLSGANLSGANLFKTLLTNTNLSGVKLDGTILAYQKASEELQRENQKLLEEVKFLEDQLVQQKSVQDLIEASNQGINAPYEWKGFYFRSKTEIKIAEALDRADVLFYPNSKARLNQEKVRVNKESDFLVFQAGKFGILEVDGRPYHQTAADDHERDRLFKRYGIRVIERFDATRCWNDPDKVIQEFLEILSQA